MSPTLRSLIVPALATTVATAILASLGTWQVHRLAWKTELIAHATARSLGPPTPAPSLAQARAADLDALDYTQVTLDGHFVTGVEARVYAILGEARGRFNGPGVWVMTPLERADGSLVWINRGFAPVGPGGVPVAYDPAPSGEVTLTGTLRRPEPRDRNTPADDVPHRLWFARDPAALAAGSPLDATRIAPYTVDAARASTPPSGLPQAGETRLSYPNDHLGYVITWYGLALTCVGVFAAFAAGRLKRGRTEKAP